MADGPRFDTGYIPQRKIYDDASGVNNAFISGLGNANLSATKDIASGISQGLDLASKGLKLYDEFGPQGQERKQLELETQRAQLEVAKNQQTITALKAKQEASTAELETTAHISDLRAKDLASKTALENHATLDKAYAGIGQIQDAQSLGDFLGQSEFNPIRTDKGFIANVQNKGINLLKNASTPEEEVNLYRSIAAASPEAADNLKKTVLSTKAQALLETPAEANAANKQSAMSKYQQDIYKRNDRTTSAVNSVLSQIKDPDAKIDYNGNTITVTSKPTAGQASPLPQVIKVPIFGKQDPLADIEAGNIIREKLRNKDFSPYANPNQQQNSPQQTSQAPVNRGVGNAANVPPSLAPTSTQSFSQLAAGSEANRTLATARASIISDGDNPTFDKPLSELSLYIKNAASLYKTPASKAELDKKMAALNPNAGNTSKVTSKYNSKEVEQIARSMFKDYPDAPPALVESTVQKALDFADQLYKQEVFKYTAKDETAADEAAHDTFGNYLRRKQAGMPHPAPEEKKSPESVDKFTTPLTSVEQSGYEAWRQTLPKRLQNTSDYDLQGYYKKNGPVKVEGDTHLTDEFKKPNHTTFSNESQYSSPDNPGGTWHGDTFIPAGNKVKNVSFVDRPEEVPSELLDAVRHVESSDGKNLLGPMTKWGQAKGPYQIIDETGMRYHERLKKKDPDYDYDTYNPYKEEQARQIAQAILADELRHFNGDEARALAAYHSGRGNVDKLGPEGRAYVPKVLKRKNQLMAKAGVSI